MLIASSFPDEARHHTLILSEVEAKDGKKAFGGIVSILGKEWWAIQELNL
jgi:hypothetical protein